MNRKPARYQSNNRNRRPNNGGRGRPQQTRFHHQDEDSSAIGPQQRRHAANQQNKFQDLANNARQSGERVETEYYMQHVEHYTRILNQAEAQQKGREESRKPQPREDDDAKADEAPPSTGQQRSADERKTRESAKHNKASGNREKPSDDNTGQTGSDNNATGDNSGAEQPAPIKRRRGRPRKSETTQPPKPSEQQDQATDAGGKDSGAALQNVLPVPSSDE